MIDFELQVIDIAKAAGAAAQQSGADVASLKTRGADLVGGPRADAGLVRAHGLDEFREAGDFGGTDIATPLEEVLEHRHGVCQDFAHLMIGCLRNRGLAARSAGAAISAM